MFRALAAGALMATVGVVLVVNHSSGAQSRAESARIAADPRTVNVNVADLVPLYRGDVKTSWKYVDELRERGDAQVIYLYADKSGNYAYVFDTHRQFVSWACAPTQPKRPLCSDAKDFAAHSNS